MLDDSYYAGVALGEASYFRFLLLHLLRSSHRSVILGLAAGIGVMVIGCSRRMHSPAAIYRFAYMPMPPYRSQAAWQGALKPRSALTEATSGASGRSAEPVAISIENETTQFKV